MSEETLKITKKDLEDGIKEYLEGADPEGKRFLTLRGLYIKLGVTRANVSSWKYSKVETTRDMFDTIKKAKDEIVIQVLEWMMYHPESKTTGMFYLKSIEKETFNEGVVRNRDAMSERLSNEIVDSVEPVQIYIDLPTEKVIGEKVEYEGKKVN